MNKELHITTLEHVIGSTHSLIDHQKCLAALTYAKQFGIENECKRMILDSRMNWLNWLTTTQRNWQGKTKNKNKARHHDSIELREKYVRVKQYPVAQAY
jgi:hypothetical protein